MLIPFVNLSPLNINSTLNWHYMDKVYNNFPYCIIISCTYSKKLNDEYSLNKCLIIKMCYATVKYFKCRVCDFIDFKTTFISLYVFVYKTMPSILLKEETDFIEPQLLWNHTKSEIFVIWRIGIVYCTS